MYCTTWMNTCGCGISTLDVEENNARDMAEFYSTEMLALIVNL